MDADSAVIVEFIPEALAHGGTYPIQNWFTLSQNPHPLAGSGFAHMYKALNEHFLVRPGDQIYESFIVHTTALAIYNLSLPFYQTNVTGRVGEQNMTRAFPVKSSLAIWRVKEASKVIFAKDDIDVKAVEAYLDCYKSESTHWDGHIWTADWLPREYTQFFRSVAHRTGTGYPERQMRSLIDHFTWLLIIVAHIANLDDCLQLPVAMKPLTNSMPEISDWPFQAIGVDRMDVFFAVLHLFQDNQV